MNPVMMKNTEQVSKMMFLDANLFVYAQIDNTEKGRAAREIIERIINKNVKCAVSVLILDEVVWAVRKFSNYSNAIDYYEKIAELPNLEILSVSSSLITTVAKHMRSGLKPRDAIHMATMSEYGIFTIISDDSDFDKVDGIEKLDFSCALEKLSKR